MTFRDLISVSTGNLWRLKLRSSLTISGVIIAIGAFVAMLSFGAGNQKYITEEFNKLGLFWTMQVYPQKKAAENDSLKSVILDDKAIDRLSRLPGVKLAYPYSGFPSIVGIGDTTLNLKAQALTISAANTKLFSRLKAGRFFSSDSSHEVLLNENVLRDLKITNYDSLLGTPIAITIKVASIDSALMHIVAENGQTIKDRLKKIEFDSLLQSEYRRRIVKQEINAAVGRFINGYFNAPEKITDTLIVTGVIEELQGNRLRVENIIIPTQIARNMKKGGFTGDPSELLSSLNNGFTLFRDTGDNNETYPSVTLDLDPKISYKVVKDSVEAMGYKSFSFAEQFDEMRKFFVYFDLALAIIGLIALTTASLGIINTMFMSILERKKEIGVLKSLGADDKEIRQLFLAESGMIGTIGAFGGILLGWVVSRISSFVAVKVMASQGLPPTELFATPPWLILIALAIGIGISLLAGIYPASRAARIDPVNALRDE
jgi:putative ABC transport system permease protein